MGLGEKIIDEGILADGLGEGGGIGEVVWDGVVYIGGTGATDVGTAIGRVEVRVEEGGCRDGLRGCVEKGSADIGLSSSKRGY